MQALPMQLLITPLCPVFNNLGRTWLVVCSQMHMSVIPEEMDMYKVTRFPTCTGHKHLIWIQ